MTELPEELQAKRAEVKYRSLLRKQRRFVGRRAERSALGALRDDGLNVVILAHGDFRPCWETLESLALQSQFPQSVTILNFVGHLADNPIAQKTGVEIVDLSAGELDDRAALIWQALSIENRFARGFCDFLFVEAGTVFPSLEGIVKRLNATIDACAVSGLVYDSFGRAVPHAFDIGRDGTPQRKNFGKYGRGFWNSDFFVDGIAGVFLALRIAGEAWAYVFNKAAQYENFLFDGCGFLAILSLSQPAQITLDARLSAVGTLAGVPSLINVPKLREMTGVPKARSLQEKSRFFFIVEELTGAKGAYIEGLCREAAKLGAETYLIFLKDGWDLTPPMRDVTFAGRINPRDLEAFLDIHGDERSVVWLLSDVECSNMEKRYRVVDDTRFVPEEGAENFDIFAPVPQGRVKITHRPPAGMRLQDLDRKNLYVDGAFFVPPFTGTVRERAALTPLVRVIGESNAESLEKELNDGWEATEYGGVLVLPDTRPSDDLLWELLHEARRGKLLLLPENFGEILGLSGAYVVVDNATDFRELADKLRHEGDEAIRLSQTAAERLERFYSAENLNKALSRFVDNL